MKRDKVLLLVLLQFPLAGVSGVSPSIDKGTSCFATSGVKKTTPPEAVVLGVSDGE